MIGNARSDELIFCRVIDKVADARYGGCIGGFSPKRTSMPSAAWLMLSASLKVSQRCSCSKRPISCSRPQSHASQYLLTTSPARARYGIACLGHVVRMLDFERDTWVGGVVGIGVALKAARARSRSIAVIMTS